jgi:large subunit ribosomal protein L17
MRHRNAGYKLGRNTSHRRAVLRSLVTSVILMDRIETTITKCKASQPLVEKMITLAKRGTVHARRQALAYMMTPESVDRLFGIVAPRYSDRNGGYTRITRTGARQGDAAEMAYIELIGAEQELDAKRQKREEARAKKREEMAKQLEEQGGGSEEVPEAKTEAKTEA